MKPVHDPASTNYPDRVFYAGRWMTEEQRKRHQARNRKCDDARRLSIQVCGIKFEYRLEPKSKDEIKRKLSELREQQSRTRREKASNGWID